MSLFKTSAAKEQPRVEIRDTLFGDMPMELWAGDGTAAQPYPWGAFAEARAAWERGGREAAMA